MELPKRKHTSTFGNAAFQGEVAFPNPSAYYNRSAFMPTYADINEVRQEAQYEAPPSISIDDKMQTPSTRELIADSGYTDLGQVADSQPANRCCFWFSVTIFVILVLAIVATIVLNIFGVIPCVGPKCQEVKIMELEKERAEFKIELNSIKMEMNKLHQLREIENSWRKQAENICYGARNDKPAKFIMKHDGMLIGIKLVHRSGFLTCIRGVPKYKSLWGCGNFANTVTLITNDRRQKIFNHNLRSLAGLNGKKSNESVYIDTSNPIYASKGMELQIRYEEDLRDSEEQNNDGVHCVDVYAKLIDPEMTAWIQKVVLSCQNVNVTIL